MLVFACRLYCWKQCLSATLSSYLVWRQIWCSCTYCSIYCNLIPCFPSGNISVVFELLWTCNTEDLLTLDCNCNVFFCLSWCEVKFACSFSQIWGLSCAEVYCLTLLHFSNFFTFPNHCSLSRFSSVIIFTQREQRNNFLMSNCVMYSLKDVLWWWNFQLHLENVKENVVATEDLRYKRQNVRHYTDIEICHKWD